MSSAPKRIINPNLSYLHQCRKDGKRGVILEGSSRCFSANQKVITETGSKEICLINIGEKVLTPSGFIAVTDSIKMKNTKPCLRIKLKNGSIIECTEDHKFFYKGSWVAIKEIINFWYGRNMEADREIL